VSYSSQFDGITLDMKNEFFCDVTFAGYPQRPDA